MIRQLNLPFAVDNYDEEPNISPIKHKIKRLEIDYVKLDDGRVKQLTVEYTYLKDGRILTGHKAEFLD